MFKKMFTLVIVGLGIIGTANVAKAQTLNLDLSNLARSNMAFDQQFNQWAWQRSLEVARWHRETGTPIPFNGMTLAEANRQTQQAYDAYNQAWYINSNRTSNAIGNWTNGAVRGMGPYQAPNGQVYNLPWTHDQYHMNQYGQFVPGYNPYRMNVTPYYGR